LSYGPKSYKKRYYSDFSRVMSIVFSAILRKSQRILLIPKTRVLNYCIKRLFVGSDMTMTESDVGNGLDARSAQDRLVEAGETLFCERGFNETSVRDIAASAGCNVASVNYYFGGKDNLYLEVWHRMLASIREARLTSINGVMSGGGQPQLEDLLRSYANSFLIHIFRMGCSLPR